MGLLHELFVCIVNSAFISVKHKYYHIYIIKIKMIYAHMYADILHTYVGKIIYIDRYLIL